MKIKFRVSTEELARLCKEMSDFLGSLSRERDFKRFSIANQVKEEGNFTFDLNVVDGFNHKNNSWCYGVVTEVEIGTQKGFCLDCVVRKSESIAPTRIEDKR